MASEGLDNVSVSQVELRAHIQFYDGITTSDIHETIIKSAADLISEETPDYQYLAARLAVFHLRKKAYGQYEPQKLYDHVARLVDLGKYDQNILQDYTKAELDELDSYIDHKRDLDFSYAAVKQLEGKYFVQNRVSEIYESARFYIFLRPRVCLQTTHKKQDLAISSAFMTQRQHSKYLYQHRSWLAYAHQHASSVHVYLSNVVTA